MDIGALTPADRNVEGVVEIMLDASQNYEKPFFAELLLGCVPHWGKRLASHCFRGMAQWSTHRMLSRVLFLSRRNAPASATVKNGFRVVSSI
jgi:hypothetical protein